MDPSHLSALALSLLFVCASAAEEGSTVPKVAVHAAASPVQSAQAMLTRLLPKHADRFVCEIIPADTARDVFEIESKSGKIVLRGNSALWLAVGLKNPRTSAASSRKKPSTKAGHECTFTPRAIRYLRATQTANSTNSGRHLVEVMAFER
ncbi:MAG: alpha-N-acetylglucosaminidase N-terminal domain-containing protein [Akkermansiaceae bacterium]|nr:alpha-N-acetylglucosaminidase N-terminal domain-containing protein [Akkermansiaceae bacterium]